MLQNYIDNLGFTPVVHFELEGCYYAENPNKELDFAMVNRQLSQLGVAGKLIPEYWHRQWEYVSSFNGQTPLQEANYLTKAIMKLPYLFSLQHIEQTLIKPVVWDGDKGKLANGCNNVFSDDERSVHIPNAIQMNISVKDKNGKNIVSQSPFGEQLQHCFLTSSLSCSLLYLPEEEAFDRFELKSTYGLTNELCSPDSISGGHQGSIALYKKLGKHNQAMGEEPLLYDHQHNVLTSEIHWQKTARVEHRLGASSVHYNAYINVIFALLNIIDALDIDNGRCNEGYLSNGDEPMTLPRSLTCDDKNIGAIELFSQDNWFAQRINNVQKLERQQYGNNDASLYSQPHDVGDKLKQAILAYYQAPQIILEH